MYILYIYIRERERRQGLNEADTKLTGRAQKKDEKEKYHTQIMSRWRAKIKE